jgi:predicted membrane channel-forming protein YqfA (hemolysin III family)
MTETSTPSRARLITGWVLTGLPAFFLLFGCFTAWHASPQVVEGTGKLGYAPSALPIIGSLEGLCAVLYLIPRTAAFGALLLTAYCGGAVASHVRVNDPTWFGAVIFCTVAWAGLLLRRPTLASAILK